MAIFKKTMVLFLCISLLAVGCRREGDGISSPNDTGTIPDTEIQMEGTVPPADTPELMYLSATGVKNVLVEYFEEANPEITVYYADGDPSSLISLLRDGGGPDIIIFRMNAFSAPDGLPQLTGLLNEGLFMDINELDVDLSACNPTVLEAGKYDGRQFFVPLFYSLGMLYTTEERLDEAGITWHEGMTLEDFSAQFPAFYQAFPEKKAFLNYFMTDFLRAQNALDLTAGNDDMLQNAETICSAYLDLFPGIFEDPADYMFFLKYHEYGESDVDLYRSGDLLFMSGRGFDGSFESLAMVNRLYTEDIEKGETPLYFPLPTADGGAPAPAVTYAIAVNANTQHPSAAAQMIESCIGYDTQCRLSAFGIPVNQTALSHMKAFYLFPDISPDEEYAFSKSAEFDHDFVQSYFSRIDNIKNPVYADDTTGNLLLNCARAMSEDGKTFEEAYAEILPELDACLSGKK